MSNAPKSPHSIPLWKAALILILVLTGVVLGSFFVMKMDQPGRLQRPIPQNTNSP